MITDTVHSLFRGLRAPDRIKAISDRAVIYCALALAFVVTFANAAGVPVAPAVSFRSWTGRCLDYGGPQLSGSPSVVLSDCRKGVSQQIQIHQMPVSQAVILRAGAKCIGPLAGVVARNVPLQVQECGGVSPRGPLWQWQPASQVFLLDGDSLVSAADTTLVAAPLNASPLSGVPIVLSRRDFNEVEFWTYLTPAGTKPAASFVMVPQEKDLAGAIRAAGLNTVIQIDPGALMNLTTQAPLALSSSMTIRGGRLGTALGPQLSVLSGTAAMFEVKGGPVRITGLRLRGPSRRLDQSAALVDGIKVLSDQVPTVIDHNELSDWTNAAVEVVGARQILVQNPAQQICSVPGANGTGREYKVRVTHNFIHDNVRAEIGYGVVASSGGFLFIDRNTFLFNRHSIADDGTVPSGYDAWFNLVMSRSPVYDGKMGHEFDMHGSNPVTGSSTDGGTAGSGLTVGRNTFLGPARPNLDVRGTPCGPVNFEDNTSVHEEDHAVLWYCKDLAGDPSCGSGADKIPVWMTIHSVFSGANAAGQLRVGDFDGDGIDDLFVATGQAWYYSSGGLTEWRFLNDMSEPAGILLFGDFDGDGKTDVFTQRGRDWLISWGGRTNWNKVNESAPSLSDFVVGDFNGDHRADIFYASGKEWLVSYGAVAPFKLFDTSSFRIPDLRFGDFNGDGKTDVFGVANGVWSVTYAGTVNWTRLRSKLTDTVAGLVVADFDGDGRADVIRPRLAGPAGGLIWDMSKDGIGDWKPVWPVTARVGSVDAIGKFDSVKGIDALFWKDNLLEIISASGRPRVHSRADLR